MYQCAMATGSGAAPYDGDALVIAKCVIDVGPTLKRWMPRAMGRANRVNHRTSHVTITVDEQQ